jgi:uncharacterized repeat protein (TIGR03803 family)
MTISSCSVSWKISCLGFALLIICTSCAGTSSSPLSTSARGPEVAVAPADMQRLFEQPRVRVNAKESFLYSFVGTGNGEKPAAPLTADSTGNLYGTTIYGGTGNRGTVFKLTKSGAGYVESVLYSFQSTGGTEPSSSILIDNSGALFGTTPYTGNQGCCGTIFQLIPNGKTYTQNTIATFGGYEGENPAAGLIADRAGSMYGTAEFGGTTGNGTIFKVTPSGSGYTFTPLYSFQGGSDGSAPLASLVMDKRGSLYGTTFAGGSANNGVVFEFDQDGTERVLHSFEGKGDGANPTAALIIDKAGVLYGTAEAGGNGGGTIFSLVPNNERYNFNVLYQFGGADGANPYGSVYAGGHGILYGTTFNGGSGICGSSGLGCGVVFQLRPSGSTYGERVIYDFSGGNGSNPGAGLIAPKSRDLLGTTESGGTLGTGTVFELKI